MKRIFLLAALLFAVIPLLAAAQSEEVLSEEAYWGRLEAIHAKLIAVDGLPAAQAGQNAAEIADELASISGVRLRDGREIAVNHAHVTRYLDASDPDIPLAARLLENILANRDSWPAQPYGSQELESLTHIMDRPAYVWPEEAPNPIRDFVEKIYYRLLEILLNLAARKWVRQIASALAVAGLAGAILYFLRNALGGVVSESELDNSDLEGEQHSASSAYARATELSQAGDYRTAVRYLYLSALLGLEERGLIRYNRSLTNREYIRSIADRPALKSRLSEIVDVFDRVWYGYQPLDEAGFEAYAGQVRRLQEERQ